MTGKEIRATEEKSAMLEDSVAHWESAGRPVDYKCTVYN
uniref:Uncharacterized protein n=1 Tax=Anguilla anguilla TaxID=7936 RepID=A0A0E9WE16_ANGAN